MKKTILWALCAAAFTFIATYSQAQTFAQFGGTASAIANDGNDQIGIGTVTPDAKLHVFGNCDNDAMIRVSNTACTPYYFIGQTTTVTGGSPPVFNTETRFVVNNNGFVGIGEENPIGTLHIRHKTYYTPTPPYYSPFSNNRVITIRDNDGYDLFTVANSGSGTTHGGALMIRAIPDTAMTSLAIYNGANNTHLAVYGDGSIGMGIGTASLPAAHLDIRTLTTQDYLLNIANIDNSLKYLTMHNSGNVGIGVVATSSTARLSVRGNIDLYYNSSTAPALRITNSGGTARHVITDASDNLLIDAGVGGSANDNLVLNGTVAIKRNGISTVLVDVVENNNSDWNAQLRFIGTDGNANHIITEVNNELYIDVGHGGNATDKLKIAGSLETTSNVTVNGSLTIKSVSGNEFKVGTDGKVRAHEVQVDLQTIPDYVFDKAYVLPTIDELNTFINEHRHLPNIPSECEYEQRGTINIAELNVKLLEKVEELSLYIIQLNERIKTLENEK